MALEPRSWHGAVFPHGGIPPEAVAWRMARVDEVIEEGGNMADVSRAWGTEGSALVIRFLRDRSPERLAALRAGYRRTALDPHAAHLRCLVLAMGARLGLSRQEIAGLIGISLLPSYDGARRTRRMLTSMPCSRISVRCNGEGSSNERHPCISVPGPGGAYRLWPLPGAHDRGRDGRVFR